MRFVELRFYCRMKDETMKIVPFEHFFLVRRRCAYENMAITIEPQTLNVDYLLSSLSLSLPSSSSSSFAHVRIIFN